MTKVAYYADDHVTIYHGDCLELPGLFAVAEVMVTDPPYGINWTKRGGGIGPAFTRPRAGIANDHDTTTRDAALYRWGNRPAVVFGSLYAAIIPPFLRHVLIWEKPNDAGVVGSTLGFRRDIEAIYLTGPWPPRPPRSGSVIRSVAPNVGGSASPAGQTGHPHSKPVDLMRALLEAAPVGTVLDPFVGSGSTLRAAKDLGRRAIGIEIEERYCEIAARRCAQEVLTFDA